MNFSTLARLSASDGAAPYGGLVLGPGGKFYGTTSGYGTNGQGTIFEVSTSGVISVLYTFTGGTDGGIPLAPLLLASNGNFYGTTSAGGTNSNGTIFEITPEGQFTNLFAFDFTNGSSPEAALIQGRDGNFYGTTAGGGSNGGFGTIFRFTTNGVLDSLFSFGETNGSSPVGALVQAPNGSFYGVTENGGSGNFGTVFELANGTFMEVYDFTNLANPEAGLIVGPDGYLYGTTYAGGTNGSYGTVFELAPVSFSNQTAIVTTLFSFGRTNGANPVAPLFIGADGNFYGTTLSGGSNGSGTIFELTTNGVFTNLYSFGTGGNPRGGLAQGADGNLYGTTTASYTYGSIFKLSGFPPSIIAQPASRTVPTGSTVVFSVSAVGSAPLYYQWQRNSNDFGSGVNISGTTSPTLTLNNVTTNQSGTNWVIVYNDEGSVTSAPAVLEVDSPPEITISSPGRNARVAQSPLTVSGRTSDNVAVNRVYCRLGDGGWVLAGSDNNWTTWSARLTPSPGSNTVQAYAVNLYDLASATSSVSFFSTTEFTEAEGNYSGLFYDETNGVGLASSGFVNVSVTDQGTFSGKLHMSSGQFPFRGAFDTNGFATVPVKLGKTEAAALSLAVDLSTETGQMTGLVSNTAWTAELLANRPAFNAKTNNAPFEGRYTLVIPGAEETTNGPDGDSYGTLTVSAKGNVVFSGSLADGTSVGQSTTVAPSGQWPFFARLYDGQGEIIGWLNFTSPPASSLGGSVTWIKLPQAKSKVLPLAFTNETTVLGSSFAYSKGSPIVDLTNAVLVLNGGGLAQSLTNSLPAGAGAQDKISSTNVHLSFVTGTGAFSGTVEPGGKAKALRVRGVVLQNIGVGRGYFLNTNQSGQVLIQGSLTN